MKNKQHLTTNFITPFFVAEGLGMRLLLILLLSSATIHYTKAQTITSLLTQTTTDLLKGDVSNGFSWKNMTYTLLSTNIYAKGGDEPKEPCTANNIGAIGYGSCSYCLGPEGYGDYDISYQCTPTGWHETGRQKKQTVLVGGGGSSGGNNGNGPPTGTPSNNDKPADWYPPSAPTEPTDINGGGGAIGTPWQPQPNDNPNNNNHNPTKPTKPYTTLGEDSIPPKATIQIVKIIEPEKENCDSIDNAKGLRLTQLLDTTENTPQMQDLRDNLNNRKFEVGFVVNQYITSLQVRNYDTTGSSRGITVTIEKYTIADVHSHPPTDSSNVPNVSSPSAPDIVSLVHGYNTKYDSTVKRYDSNGVYTHTDTFRIIPHKHLTSFVVANGNDYAISIDDTAKANNFAAKPNNALDSLIKIDGNLNSWKGTDDDDKTLRGQFYSIREQLKRDKYSEANAEYYAQIIMAQNLGMGIAAYKKVDGKFRKLRFEESADGKHYKLFICNN